MDANVKRRVDEVLAILEEFSGRLKKAIENAPSDAVAGVLFARVDALAGEASSLAWLEKYHQERDAERQRDATAPAARKD